MEKGSGGTTGLKEMSTATRETHSVSHSAPTTPNDYVQPREQPAKPSPTDVVVVDFPKGTERIDTD